MASIGSLTADLRLESAAFIRDLKRAADATARNTSAMQRDMARLQGSFATAAKSMTNALKGLVAIAAIRQLARLGSQAITTADEIAAASRKIGISAEELQRYRFAADQADVSAEQLTDGLRLFQKQLALGKVAAEGDTLTEKFTNFLRQVEKAPTMADKFRIAYAGLGKQAQTAMLIAAGGVDEFTKSLKDSFVVSNQLIAVGDKLDDQWAQIQNALAAGFQTGFLQQFVGQLGTSKETLEGINVAARALGGLLGIIAVIVGQLGAVWATVFGAIRSGATEVAAFLERVVDFGRVVARETGISEAVQDWLQKVSSFKSMVQASYEAIRNLGRVIVESISSLFSAVGINLDSLNSAFQATANAANTIFNGVQSVASQLKLAIVSAFEFTLTQVQKYFGWIQVIIDKAKSLISSVSAMWESSKFANTGGRAGGVSSVGSAFADSFNITPAVANPFGEGVDPAAQAKAAAAANREAAETARAWNTEVQNGLQISQQVQGPYQQYIDRIAELNSHLQQGTITAAEFGTAQRMAAATAIQPWLQVAGTVGDALGQLFGENKAVAIAQAIINTAQGITAALAQGGMFGWVQAAAIAAAGAAQIATIAKTKPGSTGAPKVRGGGGGGGAEREAGEAATGGGLQQSIVLQIKGDIFGPDHFRKMVEGINGVQRDGTAVIRIA